MSLGGYREQTRSYQRRGLEEGWSGRLELADVTIKYGIYKQ